MKIEITGRHLREIIGPDLTGPVEITINGIVISARVDTYLDARDGATERLQLTVIPRSSARRRSA